MKFNYPACSFMISDFIQKPYRSTFHFLLQQKKVGGCKVVKLKL